MRALKVKETDSKEQNVLVINVDDEPETERPPPQTKSTKIPVLKAKEHPRPVPLTESETIKALSEPSPVIQELSNGFKTSFLPASPSTERQLSYLKLACLVNGYDSFEAKSGEVLKEQREEDELNGDIRLKSSSDVLNSSERFYDLKKKEPKDAWSTSPIKETAKKEETEPMPETKQITKAEDTKQMPETRSSTETQVIVELTSEENVKVRRISRSRKSLEKSECFQ